MTQALNYIYYIFDSFIDLVFNRMEIASNVSVGWIMVSITLFALIIRSILNLPKGMTINRPSQTTYYNSQGQITGYSTRGRK